MHAKALYACPLPDSAELYIRAGCTRMRTRRVHIISIGREDESMAYKTERTRPLRKTGHGSCKLKTEGKGLLRFRYVGNVTVLANHACIVDQSCIVCSRRRHCYDLQA